LNFLIFSLLPFAQLTSLKQPFHLMPGGREREVFTFVAADDGSSNASGWQDGR
jgi:hypothetical protein